eukprot:3343996-Rhodomonas_salina.1
MDAVASVSGAEHWWGVCMCLALCVSIFIQTPFYQVKTASSLRLPTHRPTSLTLQSTTPRLAQRSRCFRRVCAPVISQLHSPPSFLIRRSKVQGLTFQCDKVAGAESLWGMF